MSYKYYNDEENLHEEVDPRKHKRLLQGIDQLGTTQYVGKALRSEPALALDEFHLVKLPIVSSEGKKKPKYGRVNLTDLARVLNKTKKHLSVGKALRSAQTNKKVLQKPVEHSVVDRIQRTVGYEKTKKNLSRWDAIVAQNRANDHQVFPLDYEEVHLQKRASDTVKTRIKSDLMINIETIEVKLHELRKQDVQEDNIDEHKLKQKQTRDELSSRRKELAYLRMRLSQKSAKARLRNKIKSKKYHKHIKREKLKEQLKDFEILQKVNPEAALEKLEKIEKIRVAERASLRHKNTGTWAKNLQVRAKYDKEVRKDLAEQLALSKELTQKTIDKEDNESNEGYQDEEDMASQRKDYSHSFNPWVKQAEGYNGKNDHSDLIMSDYRNYWINRNKIKKNLDDYRPVENKEVGNVNSNGEDTHKSEKQDKNEYVVEDFVADSRDLQKCNAKSDVFEHKKNTPFPQEVGIRKRSKEKKLIHATVVSGWFIEDVEPPSKSENIDDLFDNAEDALKYKIVSKLRGFKVASIESIYQNIKNKTNRKTNKTNLENLSFTKVAKRPQLDEEMSETFTIDVQKSPINHHLNLDGQTIDSLPEQKVLGDLAEIDPNKIAQIKPKTLKTLMRDLVPSEGAGAFDETYDIDADVIKQMTIAEAFADDDILADFERDRNEEKTKNISKEVDLTIPGWGSWAGCGISKEKQTTRLILKFPKDAPRKDENKGGVYIREDMNEKLKSHLVSELPFPFKSVKEYEASIRAPIGRTFVPETAFRVLTKPAIITKMGKIINPLNEQDLLLSGVRRPKTVIDVRIQKLNNVKK